MATHADGARPAVVELPLYVVWRVAYALGNTSDWAADALDAYQEAEPTTRRLAALASAIAAVALALAVLVVVLLFA